MNMPLEYCVNVNSYLCVCYWRNSPNCTYTYFTTLATTNRRSRRVEPHKIPVVYWMGVFVCVCVSVVIFPVRAHKLWEHHTYENDYRRFCWCCCSFRQASGLQMLRLFEREIFRNRTRERHSEVSLCVGERTRERERDFHCSIYKVTLFWLE